MDSLKDQEDFELIIADCADRVNHKETLGPDDVFAIVVFQTNVDLDFFSLIVKIDLFDEDQIVFNVDGELILGEFEGFELWFA